MVSVSPWTGGESNLARRDAGVRTYLARSIRPPRYVSTHSMSSNSKLDGEDDTERGAELADLIVWKHILPLLEAMVATSCSDQ